MTNKRNLSLLIVDDEPKITELLAFSLRKKPFDIKTAQSAQQALDIMSDQGVDILVTDIRMPEMDGLELCRRVRNKFPLIQVIVISAHGDVDSAIEALKLGVADFLQKPVDPKVLEISLKSSADKWHLINELNKARRELELEKELIKVTFDSIGDGVIATDVDGKVTMFNKISEELTGWSEREAIGKPLTEVFHIINENTRVICDNLIENILETGCIIGLANHTALISKDGIERSIADSAAPIRNRNSEIVGTVLVFRDVTLENRVNVELAKTEKLESIGILAGGIAHDFNNILTGIMGNIDLAIAKIASDNEAISLLSAAEKAVQRASKLTQQLLTFSKGGEPVLELESIYDLVRESADFTLMGSGIACRIDRGAELWAAHVDRGQISQVIQNIVLNARQAMPEGGAIHILCENFVKHANSSSILPISPGDYMRIAITDEGVGMHPGLLETIFDPYFSTKQEGSGLGMAITLSIITKHQGYIECESTPGQGSIFTLYLPATRESVADKSHKFEEHKGSGKIMIMDDEEMIRLLMENMLENCGYSVIHACDGEEALKLYKEAMEKSEPFDLVIMDLTIPGGEGGKETIGKLLELDPRVSAIVSSGYSNDPVMANFKDYGFKNCLSKPYVQASLIEVLSKVMQK
ncbi:MAG: response regulator [Gammaproteobacteria bacterium]|nr:response regulator [Gammaproteobacteria bacterium]